MSLLLLLLLWLPQVSRVLLLSSLPLHLHPGVHPPWQSLCAILSEAAAIECPAEIQASAVVQTFLRLL